MTSIHSRVGLLFVSLAALLGLGAAAASQTELSDFVPADPASAANSFDKMQCSRCHSYGGAANRGPDLVARDLGTTFFDAFGQMWNHAPAMLASSRRNGYPWPKGNATELTNTLAFITGYRYYLTKVGRPGQAQRGEALFRDKGCASCHKSQPDIKKGSVPPPLERLTAHKTPFAILQAMWNHGPRMQAEIERRQMPRPTFRRGEMGDVLAYLARQQSGDVQAEVGYVVPGDPSRGRRVFLEHKCNSCHALNGVGGRAVLSDGLKPPDLGRASGTLRQSYTDIVAAMWNHAVQMWGAIKRSKVDLSTLQGEDLADLVAFLFFANYLQENGDAQRGAQLFAEKGCVTCHRLQRDQSIEGMQPSANRRQLLLQIWQALPEMVEQCEQRGLAWPVFQPGDLSDVTEFLVQRAEEKKPH